MKRIRNISRYGNTWVLRRRSAFSLAESKNCRAQMSTVLPEDITRVRMALTLPSLELTVDNSSCLHPTMGQAITGDSHVSLSHPIDTDAGNNELGTMRQRVR